MSDKDILDDAVVLIDEAAEKLGELATPTIKTDSIRIRLRAAAEEIEDMVTAMNQKQFIESERYEQ